MSEHDTSNTTTNEQHTLILKLIQERITAKLEDLENNRNSNDSLLETLKTEINGLLESGNNINNSLPKPEVVDEASTPKPKPGVKINTDESAIGNVPKSKVPATTKEAKTGQTEGKDSKGKSDKPQSLNDVPEEKKTEATPKTQKKPVTSTEHIKPTKPEPKKNDKPVKKGPTDTKKKEEEKGHEEEKHEEDATDQEQPAEVLALKEVNKSLQAISKKDLSALATLAKPSASVEKVFSAVLAVLGEKETWLNAKTVLKKPDFLTKLPKVKAESLSDKVTKKVRETLAEPENSEENVAKANPAAEHFVKWLNCLIKVRDFKKGPEPVETQEKEKENAPEEKAEQKTEPVEEKKEGEVNPESAPHQDESSPEALTEACKAALKPLDFNKVQMATAAPNPAPKVVKVFEVICILLGEKASWDNAKKVAKFKDFLKKLENLKPESVSDKTFMRVKQVITDEGLKPEALASGNAAAKQLCQWVTSFVKLKEITKGAEGEVKEGNEGETENKEHNAEHAEEKKEEAEGEKEKGAKEPVKKDAKKAVDSKKEVEKNPPKRPVTAAKKDDKKDDKTKAKAPKKDEKKEEAAGEEKAEHSEEKKEHEGEAKKVEAKKGTDTKAHADAKTAGKRPVTAAKKDDKKEEKKEKDDKTKEAKKEDKEKDTKTVTTPKATKDKAPKEEKKAAPKPAETKKTEKQTAKPELKSILDTIPSSDLAELKAMAKPPAHIVDAVNLVSLLVQGKEQPWADLTKAFLTNTVTLHKALNVNLANISQENIDAVNKKITDSNIDEGTLRKKSSACVALFKWVKEAIKLSEQAKQNPTEEHKDLNGVEHPHEEHAAQETPKKEEVIEVHSEPHLNGEQAHAAETHQPEEAEKKEEKEEPVKVEEQKQEINLQEAFDKLSEALGYNVQNEVTDGNLEHYVKEKFKELEDKIKTLNAQNAELKNAGVPENVEKDKNFAQNEGTSELLKTVEKGSVTELLGQENWDEETYNILALAFLIRGDNDVPSQSDKDKLKGYVKEKLENEEDPAGFLNKLGENIHLDTQKKIELQDFLKGKQSIFDFQGANVFSKGVAAITKDVCEHLGVISAESATETSVKERVYAFNEEKIALYNLKENKIIEIAHKYNVALDS